LEGVAVINSTSLVCSGALRLPSSWGIELLDSRRRRNDMAGTNQQLRRIAIAIVAEDQPCRPYHLLGRLRNEYGASHRAANETLLTLIRDGLPTTDLHRKLMVR
jgi:hypothetical protein